MALEDLLSELEGDPGICKMRICPAHPIHLALYHQDLPLPTKLMVHPLKSPETSSQSTWWLIFSHFPKPSEALALFTLSTLIFL